MIGRIFMVLALITIGFLLYFDPGTQAKFRKNYITISKEGYSITTDLLSPLFSINAMMAIQILSGVLSTSFILLFKKLRYLCFIHLTAFLYVIGMLVCVQKTEEDTGQAAVYILKSLAIVGGLLYYIGQ